MATGRLVPLLHEFLRVGIELIAAAETHGPWSRTEFLVTKRLSCIRTHVHQVQPNTDGVTYCSCLFDQQITIAARQLVISRTYTRWPLRTRSDSTLSQSFQRIHGSFLYHVLSCRTSQTAVKCDPLRGASFVGHLASCSSFFAVEMSPSRSGRTPIMGDLRHRFTDLSHEIRAHHHGSGSENSPEFSG